MVLVPLSGRDRSRRTRSSRRLAAGLVVIGLLGACGSDEPPTLVGSGSPASSVPANSVPEVTTTVPGPVDSTSPPSPGASPSTSRPSTPGHRPSSPPNLASPPATTIPADPRPPGGAQRVQVVPGAVDLRPRPYESAHPAGDTTVAVRFYSGVAPCEVLGRVDVAETADAVTITLFSGRDPVAGDQVACIMIAVYNEVLVSLPSPLAGRRIVDGAA